MVPLDKGGVGVGRVCVGVGAAGRRLGRVELDGCGGKRIFHFF